jgi:hypothetical protein
MILKDRIFNPRTFRLALLCASLILCASFQSAVAQSARTKTVKTPSGESRTTTMRVELGTPVAETPVPFVDGRGVESQLFSFVTPDTNFDDKLVRGAPFSADAVTESVQTLGDGNRLVRKSSARIYRDSAGRTRREHALSRGGQSSGGEEPQLIVINDPVAQSNYLIETATKTVRKRIVPPGLAEARQRAMSGGGGEGSFGVLMPTSAAHRRMAEGDDAPAPQKPKQEKLESQLIEGVMAEGTRVTITIPAGEFDNEQPLAITHEQWYSPELQMIVLMKHNDPRFGETVFRLTNVSRGEPSHDLFEPPQGYKQLDAREQFPFPGRRLPGER